MARFSTVFVLALACGCSGTARWSVPKSDLDRVPLSVAATGDETIFASGGALGSGGAPLFLRGDGKTFTEVPISDPDSAALTLWWVHALSATEAFTVGEKGLILHWDGTQLQREGQGVTGETLYGAWGASAADVWAVGGTPAVRGVILRRQNGQWSTVPSPVAGVALFKVWGAAANDVFACGEGGTILHWDGNTWTQQPTGLGPTITLFTVHGRAHNDVYAVGGLGRGVALHYDGNAWSPISDPLLDSAGSLAGISVDADGSVLMVGEAGTKLRGRVGALVDDRTDEPHDDLHAALAHSGELFAVGGNYIAPAGTARKGVIARFGK